MNTTNTESQDYNIRSGIFGTYARKHIEETHPYQMDMLQLIGSLDSFLEQAAIIGRETNIKFIQNGRDAFSAKELANDEMVKYIDANIEDYA